MVQVNQLVVLTDFFVCLFCISVISLQPGYYLFDNTVPKFQLTIQGIFPAGKTNRYYYIPPPWHDFSMETV